MRLRPLAALSLLITASIFAAPADSFTGRWVGQAKVGEEVTPAALDLAREANGEWSAKLTLPAGHFLEVPVGPLKEDRDPGTLKGERLSARLIGDELQGEISFGGASLQLHRGTQLPPLLLPSAAPGRLAEKWTKQMGAAVWAAPTAFDHRVVIVAENGSIHAIDAAGGREVWTTDTGAKAYGSATVSGKRLYVLNEAGMVVALECSTGREAWRKEVGGGAVKRVLPASDVFDFDYKGSSPVVADGRLYVGTADGDCVCLDEKDGTEIWRTRVGGIIRSDVAVKGNRIAVGSLAGTVTLLDRENGNILWTRQTGGPVLSGPVLLDNLAIAGSRSANLFAYAQADGAERWKRFQWFSWIESTPAVADGILFTGSSDNRWVRAAEAISGNALWTTPVHGWSWGTPVVHGGTVFYTTSGTVVNYPLNPQPKGSVGAIDRQTGKLQWVVDFPLLADKYLYGFAAGPAVVGDLVIVAGLDGVARAYPIKGR